MTLKELHNQVSQQNDTPPMPVLFVGHGTPMNAIESNEFSKKWITIGKSLPVPRAIVCISAHWETRGTYVTAMEQPKTIHDFYGFPAELYNEVYRAKGSPQLAKDIQNGITAYPIEEDLAWGLDHGCWSVLKFLYPHANVPVIQLSIDHYKDLQWHFDFAKELSFLRTKGVLIVGSGNMIHNLRMMQILGEDFNAEYGFGWASELNEIFKKKIEEKDYKSLVNYASLHKDVRLAIPTFEHYVPLLYTLALQDENDNVSLFNDKIVAGSLSMTSVIIGG